LQTVIERDRDVSRAESKSRSFFCFYDIVLKQSHPKCDRSGAPILQDYVAASVGIIGLTFTILVCCVLLREVAPKKQKEDSLEVEWGDRHSLPPYLQKEIEMTASPTGGLMDLPAWGPVDQRKRRLTETLTPEKRPIPGVARSLAAYGSYSRDEQQSVKAVRGGEFVGNRMRFKVKVLNESKYTITDVRVFLISYPSESLRLVDEDDYAYYSKIEPSGFRSPSFDFLPTHDCVKGEISAGVSYVDMKGQPHTLTTKPFVIRSVCDLLIPDQIDPKEFTLRLKQLECGEIVVKVTDWTPEEMYEKALHIVEDANFFEVISNIETKDGIIHARISGLAKGKFTGKSVAAELHIKGPSGKKGASCKVKVSGEDQAMILPAIDDLRERLNAWLCPMCSSPLTLENVEQLKDGKTVVCQFCRVSIGR